jgi:hypothetical protein
MLTVPLIEFLRDEQFHFVMWISQQDNHILLEYHVISKSHHVIGSRHPYSIRKKYTE